MNKRFLLGAIPVIAIMLLAMAGTALAGNGRGKNIVKVPLIVFPPTTPVNYPFDGGWVVFGGGKEEVTVHVIIKGVLPNYEYTVYLEINYGISGWSYPILGTLTTNESGNGEFKGAYPLPSGTYILGIDVADINIWTAQFVSDGNEDGNWDSPTDMHNTVIVDIGTGFDEFGYNYQARIFNGIADGVDRILDGDVWGDPTYGNDHLVMKWSKAWDDARFGPDGIRNTGDELAWTPEAWDSNEWNGMVPGGSGEVWHYKIVWVGSELEDSEYWREGGAPIWGEFEILMSQGTVNGEHIWETHAQPTGYGGA